MARWRSHLQNTVERPFAGAIPFVAVHGSCGPADVSEYGPQLW